MTTEEIGGRFKALGDVTRLRILALLGDREYCNCELVDIFGISQPAISRHMARLKEAKLVQEERRGQWIYYSWHPQLAHGAGGLSAIVNAVRKNDLLIREAAEHDSVCTVPVKG